MIKNIYKIVGVIILLVVFIEQANALGISVNREVPYIANTTGTYNLCLRNTKDEPDQIKITIEGVIKDLISLNFPDLLTLDPMSTECFSYNLNMPQNMSTAGVLGSYITATELPKTNAAQGGINFQLLVSVKHRITMRVPYPGKYMDITLDTQNVKEGEPVFFGVNAISRGTETIKKISGTGEIYDSVTKKLQDTIRFSEEINVKTGDEVVLTSIWDTKNKNPGEYYIGAKVDFDEKSEVFQKSFLVGSLELKVTNYTQIAYNDSVNKFDLEVQSNWNDPIENIYADIIIKKGKFETSFRLPSVRIEPFSKNKMSSFWETRNTDVGVHDVFITLHYADKTSTKQGTLEVIARPEEKPSPINTTTVLIAVIVLIIIVNIGWFIFGKLKKKKEGGHENQSAQE